MMPSLGSKPNTSLAFPAKVKEAQLVSHSVVDTSDAKRSPPKSSGAATKLNGALSYKRKSIFDSKDSAIGSLKRLLDIGIVDNSTLCAI